MQEIVNRKLWIGNARDARDVALLNRHGMTTVVDLAAEEPPAVLPRSMCYLRFPLHDDGNNPTEALNCVVQCILELLRPEESRTLVACSAGRSRSPAITAVVLHRHGGGRLDDWLPYLDGKVACDISPALWRSLAALP